MRRKRLNLSEISLQIEIPVKGAHNVASYKATTLETVGRRAVKNPAFLPVGGRVSRA
jgi:hypothetical protein